MKLKTWAPLILAVVLGLIAMQVARNVMNKNKPAAGGDGGTSVVVVKTDLQPGQPLTVLDLSTVKWGGEINPQAVFTNPADLDGRVLVAPAAKGTPVLESMLAPKGAGSGMQALIPEGMRAVTIEINEFSGVAGNVVPGSRVDVVATLNEGGEMISRTIVQNLKVQSMGMRQSADPNAPTKSVTLIASPKEAEAIELACATGKPRLVLRGTLDNNEDPSEGITVAELRSGSAHRNDPFAYQPVELLSPTPAIASKPGATSQPSGEVVKPVESTKPERRPLTRQRQVRIIRGGVESSVTFEELATPINSKWITGAPTDELPSSENNK